jgi:glycosyltransferase involved in cell wall biosynthesis
MEEPKIAVLLPCLNEGQSISEVVARSFKALPTAKVYVYDNGSEDNTFIAAENAGAITRRESKRGKGNVVRRMFADIDADIYVMFDGDGTYEVEAAPFMVDLLIRSQLDLVTGKRVDERKSDAVYRFGHRIGNKVFTYVLKRVFGSDCEDVLSGYRVMSKRFVKSFPSVARGFEIEVEMTAHASLLQLPSAEYSTVYSERPADSFSKLNTFRDGLRISRSLFRIFRSYSPSRFFGSFALIFGVSSVPFFLRWRSGTESAKDSDHLVLGAMFVVLSMLTFVLGVSLNASSRMRLDVLRLKYLSISTHFE